MNVIEGQAKQNEKIQSDFLYSLTFNNILNIIIMLILVVLSINIAIKSGLFKTAGKATKDTRVAGDKEQELAGGQVNIDGKIYASIEDYLAGKEMDTRPKIEAGKKQQQNQYMKATIKKQQFQKDSQYQGKQVKVQ